MKIYKDITFTKTNCKVMIIAIKLTPWESKRSVLENVTLRNVQVKENNLSILNILIIISSSSRPSFLLHLR